MAAVPGDFEAPGIGRRPGLLAWLLLAPLLLWLGVFVIVPTIIMIVFSFSGRDALGEIVYTPTLENYRRFITVDQMMPVFVAIGLAVLSGGVAVAISLTRWGRRMLGGSLGLLVPIASGLVVLGAVIAIDVVVMHRFASTFDFAKIASYDPVGAKATFIWDLNLHLLFLPLCSILGTSVMWSLIAPTGMEAHGTRKLIVACALSTAAGVFYAGINLVLLVHLRGVEYESMPLHLVAVGPQMLRIFVVSVNYAAFATAICVVMGYPVAYFIGKAPDKWRNMLLMLVMIPFWTSFLVRTYAWVTILRNEGVLNSLLLNLGLIAEPFNLYPSQTAVMIGLVYTYLPFMILPIYTSIERLDNALVEAAFDLGASPLRAFNGVILPLTKPGVVAGILLVFVPAVGMFAVNDVLGGRQEMLIGNVIERQFTAARDKPFGSALGMLLLVMFSITYYLMNRRRAGVPD